MEYARRAWHRKARKFGGVPPFRYAGVPLVGIGLGVEAQERQREAPREGWQKALSLTLFVKKRKARVGQSDFVFENQKIKIRIQESRQLSCKQLFRLRKPKN